MTKRDPIGESLPGQNDDGSFTLDCRSVDLAYTAGRPLRDPLGLILSAAAFAAEKHRRQKRKDAESSPYINHPIAVANVLRNEGSVDDIVVLCAALLHDTIEDTNTTAEELTAAFGPHVAGVVLEVTDDKSLDKEHRKRLQIEHAPALSHRAKLVKLADKICNLRDIVSAPPRDWDAGRRRDYFTWAKRVVDGFGPTNPALEAAFAAVHRRGV